MTAMKKAGFLNPHLFKLQTGKKEYMADIPDGNQQLKIQVFSDEPVQIYLGAGDIALPIGCHTHFNRTIRVADGKFLLFKTTETANVAIAVGTRPIRIREEPDHTPVDISVPAPLQIDISKMVSQLVGEALKAQGDGTEIDMDTLIDELPEGADPEFGPGFTIMQEDDPGVQRQLPQVDKEIAAAKAAAAKKAPQASTEPVAGDTNNGNVKPST